MPMELDNVIRKIQKLSAMTIENGCSEGEVMNAAMRIGELLQTYNLTIDKVFLDQNNCIQKSVDTGGMNIRASGLCVIAIAKFCDCKVWSSKKTGCLSFNFFGMPTDVEMAIYLYGLVDKSIELETSNYKLTKDYLESDIPRKTLYASFQRGMVDRINARFDEITEERHEKECNNNISHVDSVGKNTVTSIVLLKHNKVESEFEKLGMHLRTKHSYSRVGSRGAYSAGQNAGNSVNLNRPISGKSTLQLT